MGIFTLIETVVAIIGLVVAAIGLAFDDETDDGEQRSDHPHAGDEMT